MDAEENKLLEKSVELAEDSNRILHSIRRSMRISTLVRAVYWIFIIGSAIGAYYFIQPYIDQLLAIYGGAQTNLNSFGDMLKNFNK